ncbi:MAG TPA: 16S rRNA (guanine(527)-N(7))-methyltransferase RsmG [Candidatus Dormibacteraeota bacterium]|jgi:16S rRNA (guanine527-N7)-methyltransferase|nr:16S rRNA (guanine(527)-N(7))-methyltransferase RsmG [Candidatus Dormibacteraeota bacterium]
MSGQAAARMGLTWDTDAVIDAGTRSRLQTYLRELHRFNQRINLTTVAEEQAWQRHVDESRRLLQLIQPVARARVVDIGSGAGVPGIPMAVLRDDLRVTLLDADERRCGFLLHVCGVLGLQQVTVVCRRAEVFGHDPDAREAFDCAVSRAAAPPPVLCELALPLVRVGGVAGWLVGDAVTAATQCAYAARSCGGGLPQAADADIVTVIKEASTPTRFPRRTGVPARRPLLAAPGDDPV